MASRATTTDQPAVRTVRRPGPALAAVLALLVLPPAHLATAGPAAAQSCGTTQPGVASLSVDTTTLPADRPSTVTVRGSRYLTGLYPCGGSRFGGIYLFFGWVAPGGQWGPSHRNATDSNGQYGITYHYPGEGGSGETRDDGSGTLRLVSFTTGGISGSETPFHMDGAGNWSATLNIAGPVYSWRDIVTGAGNSVDCRVFRCGVYTVGAHGVASASNEQFVPLTFAGAAPATTAPAAPATPAPSASGTAGTTGTVGAAGATGSTPGGAGATTTVPRSTTAPPTTTTIPGASAGSPSVAGASTTPTTRRSTTTTPSKDRDEDAVEAEAASVRVDGTGSTVPWVALALVALVVAGASGVVLRRRRGGVGGPVGAGADLAIEAGADPHDVGTVPDEWFAAVPPTPPTGTPPSEPVPPATPPPFHGVIPPAQPSTSTEGDHHP